MKAWQKILVGALSIILLLVFGIGYLVYSAVKKLKEGFQAAAASPTTTNRDPNDPGTETMTEKDAYDMYEYKYLLDHFNDVPTLTEKYDPAGALAEFDFDAPVPWDFDNKEQDPKDILWGSVDSRCSKALWENAYLRRLFDSANNFEFTNDGAIGYYSTKMNGKLYYDPGQIAAIKYAEFFIDYAMEETIEWLLEERILKSFEEELKLKYDAKSAARIAVFNEIDKAKAGNKILSKAELKTIRNNAYNNALKQLARGGHDGGDKGVFKKALSTGYNGLKKGLTNAGKWINRNVISRLFFHKGQNRFKSLRGSTLIPFGRGAKQFLQSIKAVRSLKLFKSALMAVTGCTLCNLIPPPFGQIAFAICEILPMVFIVIIPQILNDLTDLDEDPLSSNCDESTTLQGCPDDHKFNIRCGIIEASGPAVWEIIASIPFIGDALTAFGPYLCTSETGDSVYRQSFRPPPYYFDSTLSLFTLDKPKVLQGSAEYDHPGNLKTDKIDKDGNVVYKTKTVIGTNGNKSEVPTTDPDTEYHPWVDFSHSEMLEAMAQFYYENSLRFQTVNIDGTAEFEVINNFKGLISSSQLSCDVQVELDLIKYKPFSGELIVTPPTPTNPTPNHILNPVEEGYEQDTGCNFHDRRFYFTIDYTKANPAYVAKTAENELKSQSTIQNEVNKYLEDLSIDKRVEAYRRMFVVIGCTHTNGSAPNVMDVTSDGELLGDAPVALAQSVGTTYYPPALGFSSGTTVANFQETINSLNQQISSSSCSTVSSSLRHFGLNRLKPPMNTPSTSNKPTAGIYPTNPSDFTSSDPNSPFHTAPKWKCIYKSIGRHDNITESTEKGRYYAYPDMSKIDLNGSTYISLDPDARATHVANNQPSDTKTASRGGINADGGWHWTNGTTKYWEMNIINASAAERWGQGLQGAAMAALTLYGSVGGVPVGGIIATTLDATGGSGAIACAYSDAVANPGTYMINGRVLTVQSHFMIDRGPAILYAPGYTPTYSKRCDNLRLKQLDCASRYSIRRMVKMYQTANPTSRIQFVGGAEPRGDICLYNLISANIVNGSVSNSSVLKTVGLKHAKATRTDGICIYMPSNFVAESQIPPRTAIQKSNDIMSRDRVVDYPTTNADGSIIIQPRLNSEAKCGTNAVTCSNIFDKLKNDFNQVNLVDINNSALGSSPEIVRMIEGTSRTLSNDPATQYPRCLYTVEYNIRDNDDPTAPIIKNARTDLTMYLIPDPTNNCSFTVGDTNFPTFFYHSEVIPSNALFKVPQDPVPKGSIQRASCTATSVPNAASLGTDAATAAATAYSGCENPEIMTRLVNQFNTNMADVKILRIIRAFTPVMDATSQKVCDYEADVQRIKDGYKVLSRDTLRIILKEPTDTTIPCLWDVDIASTTTTVTNLYSGLSIDKASAEQELDTPFIWPLQYMNYIRTSINRLAAQIIQQDVPASVKTTTATAKNELENIMAGSASVQQIPNCPSSTCASTEIIQRIIDRFNYDGAPEYPQGGVASVERSIIAVRKAALGSGLTCQYELIEKQEHFSSYDRRYNPESTAAELNTDYLLTQYQFEFLDTTFSNSKCIVTVKPLTADDMKNNTFDIAGKVFDPTGTAYGNMLGGIDVQTFTGLDFRQKKIDGFSKKALNAVKAALDLIKINNNTPTLISVHKCLNARPNIVEYYCYTKTPDTYMGRIGTADDSITYVVAKWEENKWDPYTGAFVGGTADTAPLPTIDVFQNATQQSGTGSGLMLGGRIVGTTPPYMHYSFIPIRESLDENRKRIEITRVEDIDNGRGFLFPPITSSGNWRKNNGNNVVTIWNR